MMYHLRRLEKAITERETMLAIIHAEKYLTLALCRDNEPYLVTMNYGFDAAANCFYLHCADEGKKIDYWRSQPVVWGQILDDHGYVAGACDHAYRTVQFKGRVTFVEATAEKRRALSLMIDQLEPDPTSVKARLLSPERLANVTIVRIDIKSLSGKENVPPTT